MALQLARHLFTVDEYHRMAEVGLLREDDRLELIDGEIVVMSPIGRRHASRVDRVSNLFARRLGEAVIVRTQNPIVLHDKAEPEPDIALLRPRPDFYDARTPTASDVLLVIEVADSSLDYDRRVKSALYARNGIVEYWLANLVEHHVIVFRDPTPDGYRDVQIALPGEELCPLAFPDLALAVEDILG